MKTTIYYFTGTGNSLAIAKKISKGIESCTLLSISDLISSENNISECPTIGFIFPVYLHIPPKQVTQFIKGLNIKNNPYIFSIITNNGEVGRCGYLIDKELKKKGLKLDYCDSVLMPGNSIFVEGYINTEEERLNRLKNSTLVVEEIRENIITKRNILKSYNSTLFHEVKSTIMRIVFTKVMKPQKSYFTTSGCTGCGKCQKVCPANNIQIFDKTVKWGNNCEYCLACIHLCPNKASQINKNTINGLRYKHPEIELKELYRSVIN